VTNISGVHAHSSSLIVKTASKFESSITLTNCSKDNKPRNAKSIMEVLKLVAEQKNILELRADGIDEILVANAIENLFKINFEECY
jgi:phosphotransferase system HPr (HPr) family protein